MARRDVRLAVRQVRWEVLAYVRSTRRMFFTFALPDLEVVAQAARGDEALDAALATAPDVALLDIAMPGLDGLDVAAPLRAQAPAVRVLMVTTFGRPGYLRPLTPREHEVLAASLEHGTVAAIAGALHLSQGTVRNHLSAAIRKLGVRTRVEALRVAQEKGWL